MRTLTVQGHDLLSKLKKCDGGITHKSSSLCQIPLLLLPIHSTFFSSLFIPPVFSCPLLPPIPSFFPFLIGKHSLFPLFYLLIIIIIIEKFYRGEGAVLTASGAL